MVRFLLPGLSPVCPSAGSVANDDGIPEGFRIAGPHSLAGVGDDDGRREGRILPFGGKGVGDGDILCRAGWRRQVEKGMAEGNDLKSQEKSFVGNQAQRDNGQMPSPSGVSELPPL